MSSFYGDTTRLPMTPFYFDKIYNTESDMSADISNIFLNRYVLLKKTNDDGNTTGEVYQKQYIDNNEQFVLIASLTAPFTLTGDGGVIYDFNLDRKDNNGNIIKDYKTHNLYEDLSGDGKSANVQWLVGDNDQKYTLDIQLKEIGNALSEIYNALAGLTSTPEGERPYNIKFIEEVVDLTDQDLNKIILLDNNYYYVIKEPALIAVKDENEFETLVNNKELIFNSQNHQDLYNIQEGFKNGLYHYSKITSSYKLINLKTFGDGLYNLLSLLNKLKEGNYYYDRESLKGCINYANWIIDQLESIESIELKGTVEEKYPNVFSQKINLTYVGTDGNKKESSTTMLLESQDGISLKLSQDEEFDSPKISISSTLPQKTDLFNKAGGKEYFSNNYYDENTILSWYSNWEQLYGYIDEALEEQEYYKYSIWGIVEAYRGGKEGNNLSFDLGFLLKILTKNLSSNLDFYYNFNFFNALSNTKGPIYLSEDEMASGIIKLNAYNILEPQENIGDTIKIKFFCEGEVKFK